jgi:hypothetical protein
MIEIFFQKNNRKDEIEVIKRKKENEIQKLKDV